MLRITQFSGFASGSNALPPDVTAPTILSANNVTVDGGVVMAFTIETDEAATLTIGGTDAAEVELASNTLATTHVLRWASNGTRTKASPTDDDVDSVYDITITATDAALNDSSPQSFTINVPYDWVDSFSQVLNADSANWNGYTMRQLIGAALISSSGTTIRLVLEACAGSGVSIDEIFIGEKAAAGDAYDMKASAPAPTQFQVDGSNSFTILTSETATTDPLTFSLDETKDYIVSVHFNGLSDIRARSAVTGANNYYKAATSQAGTADVTGYANGGTVVGLIQKIQVAA